MKIQSTSKNASRMKTRASGWNIERALEWLLVLTLFSTTLVIMADVPDSTYLKPYFLYFFCVIMFGLGMYKLSSIESITTPITPFNTALAVSFLCAAVSLLPAHNLELGLKGLLLQGCLCVIYFVSSTHFTDERSEKRLFGSFVLISWITCLIGLAQLYGWMPEKMTILASGRNLISTLGNATYFSGFLVILIPIVLSLVFNEKEYPRRGFLILLFLTLLFTLLKTETRGSWIAGVIGIITFIVLNFENRKVRWIAIGIVLAGIALVPFLFPDLISRRLAGLFEMSSSSSITRRLFFYEGAWKAFLASPVIGHGIGNFIVFLPKFRSPDYWIYNSEDIVPHAHNEFLEIASETGALGLLSFLFLLGAFFLIARNNLKTLGGTQRTVLVGFIAAIIAGLADNIVSMNLRTVPVAVLFWCILGLSQRETLSSAAKKVMVLPPKFKNIRWLVFILTGAFFIWFIPSVTTASKAENAIMAGTIATWNHDEAGAAEKYSIAVSYDSGHGLASYYLAASLFRLHRHQEAFKTIRSLLKDYPYNPKAYIIAALSSLELRDTTGAISYIKKELALENSPQAYYYFAYIMHAAGDSEEELRLLLRMLERNIAGTMADFAESGLERLRTLANSDERRERAIPILKNITEKFPQNAKLLTASAECFLDFERRDDAEALLQKIESLPNLDDESRSKLGKMREYLRLPIAELRGN